MLNSGSSSTSGLLFHSDLLLYKDSLYWLIYREMRMRYRHAFLGLAWAVLQPAVSVLVIAGFFHQVTASGFSQVQYSLFTACGMVPWLYFSKSLSSASQGFLSYAEVLKKNYFPKVYILLAMVIAPAVDLLVGLAFLALWLVAAGSLAYSLPLWSVAVATLWLLFLCLSLSLWLAPLYVHFRDVAYALGFFLQGFFFVTPVMYSVDRVPEHWRFIVEMNPLAGVLSLYRYGFLNLPPHDLWPGLVATGALFAGGVFLFARLESGLVDRL